MPHIFISYATGDQAVAMEVCALLEARGHACWIAPRDVVPGKVWDEAILDAIESASGFLLILSAAANASPFVKNEVNRAFSLGRPILTFRVEDVPPGRSLELYLARHHWTDGFRGRIEDRVAELAKAIEAMPRDAASAGALPPAGDAPAARPVATAAWPRVRTLSSRRERIAWGAAAGCALAALTAVAFAVLRGAPYPGPGSAAPMIVTVDPPEEAALVPAPDLGLALSPDGTRAVFSGKLLAGGQQLFLRVLSEAAPRALPDTLGASFPFWAPDGQRVGFFADGKLKIVDLRGGAPRALADAPQGRGGDWGSDDLILYAPDLRQGLRVVPAAGGAPREVTRAGANVSHRWPDRLPDGRHFLFLSMADVLGPVSSRLMLGSLDGTEPRELLAGSTNAKYVAPGYLLFGRGYDLFALRFDAKSLRPTGEPLPLPVGKGLYFEPRGLLPFSASDSGALLFITRAYVDRESELRWVGRDGRPLGTLGGADRYLWPRLSPDGNRIAFVTGDFWGKSNLWVMDLRDGRRTQLSTGDRSFVRLVWSGDSRSIVVGCGSKDGRELCVKSLDDGADLRVIYASRHPMSPLAMFPDGRTLLLWEQFAGTGMDLMALDLQAPEKGARVVVRTPGGEDVGVPSPDGRWLAYISNESGSEALYVRPLAGESQKWLLKSAGAYRPRWTRGGRELLFAGADGELLSVSVGEGPSFQASEPRVLFRLPDTPDVVLPVFEDVTPDGERLLLNVPVKPASSFGFRLVLNWPALLEAKEP